MASIVSVIALAHAPGVTGWLDKAPPDQQARMLAGYGEMRRRLALAKPDVIIGVANDHLLNLPMESIPDWCVGLAPHWKGPAPWFKDWLNVADYEVAGHRDLARFVVRESGRRGVNLAFAEQLLFDDNWSVPLKMLTPDYKVALVPIHMNCVMPPTPSNGLCYRFGQVLAEVVRAWPGNERVAIMATGGLSHDPGGPKYFAVDEKFDRWFLDLLAAGDHERVLREVTFEKMLTAGDGGTVELLAWMVAMGAAGASRKAETIFYEPSVPLRCGMGGVDWNVAA